MTDTAEYHHAVEICDQLEALVPYGRYRVDWFRPARRREDLTYEGAGWFVLQCRRKQKNSIVDSEFAGGFRTRDEARRLATGLSRRRCVTHTECEQVPLIGKACLIDQLMKLSEKGRFYARP